VKQPANKPYRYRFGDKQEWRYVHSHITCVKEPVEESIRLVEAGTYTAQKFIDGEWVTIIRINLDGFWKNESGDREYQ